MRGPVKPCDDSIAPSVVTELSVDFEDLASFDWFVGFIAGTVLKEYVVLLESLF